MNKFFSMLEHDICYENEKQQAMKGVTELCVLGGGYQWCKW